MKWKDLLEEWGLTNLKISVGFAQAQFAPKDGDREAAWQLYIELLTRIATQPLPEESGDEKAALDSVYSIFGLTREIIRAGGTDCVEFTKIAIVVLNQIIRPFTAHWHRQSLAGALDDPQQCARFRADLKELQKSLLNYTRMLGHMADVEDLTELEALESSR